MLGDFEFAGVGIVQGGFVTCCMITLGFYGAAGEVTGSCSIVSTRDARVMVDLGMHQGERVADERNRRLPPDLDTLDAVVLTHAHLDHSGRLPLLMQNGFRGRIFCTAPTADVAEVILRDSAAIQAEDCERFNRRLRKGQDPCEAPLYDERDVEQTLARFSTLGYDRPMLIAPGVTVRLVDAGHILGSSSVQMTIHDGPRTVNLVFSGDIGVSGSPILRDPVVPTPADAVVMESTYGGRDHKGLAETRAELLAILREVQETGGRVLIPAFAVGRTQDLVYHIGEFIREGSLRPLRVCVDSPMATSVSQIYSKHRNVYDERARDLLAQDMAPLNFRGLTYTRSVEDSKRLNDTKGPLVIISASGMCTGGRILHHLAHGLGDARTHVVIAGYQSRGSLGRQLVDGVSRVRIFRDEIQVRAKIHTLGGFSAHAGQTGLLKWASTFAESGPRFFLNHGEDDARESLRAALRGRLGLDASLPQYGEIAEL